MGRSRQTRGVPSRAGVGAASASHRRPSPDPSPMHLAPRTRPHTCLVCGLRGDRDLVSAALGTCVQLSDPRDAGTALVDYTRAAALLGALTASDGTASDGTASDTSSSLNHGHQDALTSQTHPLVGGRHSGVHHQGARSVGSSRRAARLNASKTMPSTKGPGHPGPAKVALDSGLGHPVPTG